MKKLFDKIESIILIVAIVLMAVIFIKNIFLLDQVSQMQYYLQR